MPLLGLEAEFWMTGGQWSTILPVGWGKQPWGEAAFGAGSPTVAVSTVVADSTNTLVVTFASAVNSTSPFAAGDVLNPSTWQVTRFDTNQDLICAAVRQVGMSQVELYVVDPLADQGVAHRVATVARNGDGSVNYVVSSATCDGVVADVSKNQGGALRRSTQRDHANRPAPSARKGIGGGTLRVGADGDYVSDVGDSYLRKRIFRRLTTAPGDFFWLPDYGVGLRVKEELPSGSLPVLRQRIIDQVLRETDVESVDVSLQLRTALGALDVTISCRSRRGTSVTVGQRFGGVARVSL
jgi:hypothetical protein